VAVVQVIDAGIDLLQRKIAVHSYTDHHQRHDQKADGKFDANRTRCLLHACLPAIFVLRYNMPAPNIKPSILADQT
jgi:hypothetical protein